MHHGYTWDYRLELQPYERLVTVLEAFFASYPGGDYTCEQREAYRLRFRRGEWRKSFFGLGPLVPARMPKGQFNRWPVILRVLIRPSPAVFLVAIRYELYLPKGMSNLIPEVQSAVHQHCRAELDDLADYLVECMDTSERPAILDME
jgi:hypothetical protein